MQIKNILSNKILTSKKNQFKLTKGELILIIMSDKYVLIKGTRELYRIMDFRSTIIINRIVAKIEKIVK